MIAFERIALSPEALIHSFNTAIAASLACGVALAAVAVCGKRSAPLRHGLLLCALALTLLSPGLMWLRQQTSWGIVRVPVAARQRGGIHVRPASPPPVATVDPATGPFTEIVANESETEGFRRNERIDRRPDQAGRERERVVASVTDEQAADRNDAASWPRVLGSMVACVWAVGVCIGIVMLLRGWVTVVRLRRSCQRPPGTLIQEQAEQEASTVGLAHPPRIYMSRFVPVPLSIGLMRGVIVMPEGIERDVSEEQLRAILVHEMAHIARYDHAVGLAQRVVACLFWWNPLVHRVNAHIASLREEICDNHVARAQGGGERFARLLVDFAARITGDVSRHVGIGMLEPERKGLDGRIARLLNQERNMTTRLHPKSVLVVAGFALSLSGVLLAASAGADGGQGSTTPGGPADATKVTESKPGAADARPSPTATNAPDKSAAGVQPSEINHAEGKPAADMVLRRVWAGPRVDVLGGPSPDGRYLTFVDWETGDLAVRDLATRKNRRLTNKGSWTESSEFAYFPVPSPSGEQIAYTWWNKDLIYDLRIIGLDGSDVRVLYRNKEVEYTRVAAWSSDEEQILATLSRSDNTKQIALISVADGSVRVLKTLDWRGPKKMSLSPDGRYVAYDFPPREDSPKRDIFLLAIDGSREIPLIKHPADDLAPVWAPDGKSILFGSDRTGSMGAWVIRVVDGKAQGAPEQVRPNTGRSRPMGFTRKGSFYYGVETGMNDVYTATLDLRTGKLLTQPTRATERFLGSNSSAAWSPDGKYLAYLSQREHPAAGQQGSQVIAIRSIETGQERELSPDLNYIDPRMGCHWSPSGQSIMVAAKSKKEGRTGLYQIDAQTGRVAPLVQSEPGAYIQQSAWSPDGKAVFFVRTDSTTRSSGIIVRDLETGREKELSDAEPPAFVGNLTLSPDGRQLAFTTNHPATRSTALMVMPSVGGEPRELLRVDVIVFRGGLTWTPDGREILFGKGPKSVEKPTVELWRISADGGEPQRLELAAEGLRGLRFHPDGQRIAFSAGQPNKAEVWVMENFLPELAAK